MLLTNPVINGSRAPTAKPAVRVATVAAATLATGFVVGAIIDGETLVIEDRVLIKNQAAPIENGIYSVQSSGVPLRVDDLPAGDAASGTNVFVQSGTINANTAWVVSSVPAVVGTDPLVYVRYDVTSTLTTVRGGTGTASLGGTNTLLYTPSAGAPIAPITTAASGVLVTSAGGAPSIASTLPANLAIPTPTVSNLRIADSDGSHYYQIAPGNLASNYSLAIPSLTGNETFLFAGLDQTVTNKTFLDSSNVIANSTDPTKTGTWDLSLVPTGSNVSLQFPTQSGTVATLQYIDALINGLRWKAACVAKTTTTLSVTPAGSGPTKTLTNNGVGPIAASVLFDGVVLALGDRVLVDDAAFGDAPNPSCGIYTVTNAGSAGTPWVLTRAADANISANVLTGMATLIEQGAIYANTQWVLNTPPVIVLDTTPLSFVQFGGLTGITAGNGLVKTGNTLDVVGSSTIVAAADSVFVNSSAVANQPLLSSGTVGVTAAYGALPLGSAAAVSGTLPIARGGTGQTAFTTNSIVYAANATTLAPTNVSNSAVLVTSGTGVPNLSSTLPSALTLGSNFRVNDNDASQQYIITGGALTAAGAANSTLTLPGDAGTAINDTFTLNNLSQILQNKTLVNPIIQTSLRDTGGLNVLTIAATASAVNSLQVAGAATGSGPVLAAIGNDTNVPLNFQQKGTGTYNFQGSSTASATLRLQEQTTNGSAYVGLTVGNVPASYTLQLPLADGASGQVLRTNGAGVLSFANAATTTTDTWTLLTGTNSITSTSSGGGVVLYFTWLYSIMTAYTTGTIWFQVVALNTGTLNVDFINVSNSSQLGTLTGISSPGIYSFTVTNNIINTGGAGTSTALRVWRSTSGGTTPTIRGVYMRWLQ